MIFIRGWFYIDGMHSYESRHGLYIEVGLCINVVSDTGYIAGSKLLILLKDFSEKQQITNHGQFDLLH